MDYEYKAFISYSHRDTPWARWLLHALETYRLPAALRGPLGRAKGVGRIFRDRDEASAASDLKEEIQRALLASEHLIVIASPRSAKSAYVQAEIEAFDEANKTRAVPGHILTLMIDGEPNADDADRECFPPALRGQLLKADGSPLEPLAADARPTGDGRTRALAKLVAALLNIRYDVLVRRDLQRQRRVRLLIGGASVATLAIAGAVGAVVINASFERERLLQEREAAERDARTVTAASNAERARVLLAEGNVAEARRLAATSLVTDGSIPFIPQAYDVLYNTIFREPGAIEMEIADTSDATPTTAVFDGVYLTVNETITGGGSATVWSRDEGVVVQSDGLDTGLRVSPDRSTALAGSGNSILRFRPELLGWDRISVDFDFEFTGDFAVIDRNSVLLCNDGIQLVKLPEKEGPASVLWSNDLDTAECYVAAATPAGTALAGTWDGTVVELNLGNGHAIRTYETATDGLVERLHAAGTRLFVWTSNALSVFELGSTAPIASIESTFPALVSPDGRYVVSRLIGPPDLVIIDVESDVRLPVECFCSAETFKSEGELLALSGTTAQVFDLRSGTLSAEYAFPTAVDQLAYAEGDLLLGYRNSGFDLVYPIGDAGSPVGLFRAGDDPNDMIVEAKFLDSAAIGVVTFDMSKPVPQQPVFKAYRWNTEGEVLRLSDEDAAAYDFDYDGSAPPPDPVTPPLSWMNGRLVVPAQEESDGVTIATGPSPVVRAQMVSDQLVSAGLASGGVLVWDTRYPDVPLLTLPRMGEAADLLAVNPEGSHLLAGTKSGEINVWPLLSPDALLELAADP